MIVFTVPAGDTNGKAFMKDLYKKYSRLMYATVLRMIPDCQDSEDIVQDAVESLCKKVHTLMGLPAPPCRCILCIPSKTGRAISSGVRRSWTGISYR